MSSNIAKQYHSMTFTYVDEWNDETKKHGQINTWDDWHLIPTSRPVFNPPEVKTVHIDVPGSDGIIDMTESLSGYPNYKNREGSFEFIVANGYRSNWANGYTEFSRWLHGRRLRCILNDDPSYFYEGRFTINEWKSNNDGTWSNITIDYNVKPYKYNVVSSLEDWLWDPFNFETGFIYKAKNIYINGTKTISVHNDMMHVIPTIQLTPDTEGDTFTISMNSNTLANLSGNVRDPRFELLEGDNSIEITGTGYVSFDFRSGSL